jgi:beta-glucosidase
MEMNPATAATTASQPASEIEAVVERALGRLDLEGKVRLLTGATAWKTHGDPGIGLRPMVLSDGPAGVRGQAWDERDPSINLPSPTAMAASWDERLVGRLAGLLAAEARRKGVDVVLAPTVNLHRTPLAGRHFECMSEDPLLSGRLGTAYVRGLQDRGVGATAKHYVANDSETDRFTVDVRVDERTLRELYLAPFERMVVDGGAWLVMAAYNGVNGATMTESPLLAEPLKGEWGFDGVVVSDWVAVRSTVAAGAAACDLAMPGPDGPWGAALVTAVRDGLVPEAAIDDKVRRLLRLAARVGALEGAEPAVGAAGPDPGADDVAPVPNAPAAATAAPPPNGPGAATMAPGRAAALVREAAAAGMVLVRNEAGVLPLRVGELRRVAVVGPNAAVARTQGGGSAGVYPTSTSSPLEGLRRALGPAVEVVYAPGPAVGSRLSPVTPERVTDPVTGTPGLSVRVLGTGGERLREEHRTAGRLLLGETLPDGAATVEVRARLRADAAGEWRIGVAGTGVFRLRLDGQPVLDEELRPESTEFAAFLFPAERSVPMTLAAGQQVDVLVTHRLGEEGRGRLTLGVRPPSGSDSEELERAVAAARGADVTVVVVGTNEQVESEGFDRRSLALPGPQDELVRAVAAANPRTVVVVNSGAPVALPWRDRVAAVLLAWFPGQEFGNALADVLLGAVEPGGRLPTTWGALEPGAPKASPVPVHGQLEYSEGIHIGYGAWLRAGARPAYPFGHGLGYTTWSYERIDAPPHLDGVAGEDLTVEVTLRNLGARHGKEVVQVYLDRPGSSVERPAAWLAGFAVVEADPGERVVARVRVACRAFEHWSVPDRAWRAEPGAFRISAGRSVADRPLEARVELAADARTLPPEPP